MFPEPLKMEPEVIYIARVDLVGPSFTIGSEGEMNISGPGGVVFTLHSTALPESDPETGPVTKFLYSRSGDNHMTCTLYVITCHFIVLLEVLKTSSSSVSTWHLCY